MYEIICVRCCISQRYEKESDAIYARESHYLKFHLKDKTISRGDVHIMSVADIALARAKKLREVQKTTKPVQKKMGSQKSSSKEIIKKAPKVRKSDIPYAKVASMYDAGKPVSEISDQLGWTDKKSKWPYSYTYGILKRLRAGVEIDGRSIKVKSKRGK